MAVCALARRASQDAGPAMAPGVVVDRMNPMLGTGTDMAPGTGGACTPAVNMLEEAASAAMKKVLPLPGRGAADS
jgi:hypothetical protein